MKKIFLLIAACMAFVAGTAQNTNDTTVEYPDTPVATETTVEPQFRLDINYLLNTALDYAVQKYGCTKDDVGFFNIIQKNGEKADNVVLELAVKYKDELVSDAIMFILEYGSAEQLTPSRIVFITCDDKDGKENRGVINDGGTITSSCQECGFVQHELKPEKWEATLTEWPVLTNKE